MTRAVVTPLRRCSNAYKRAHLYTRPCVGLFVCVLMSACESNSASGWDWNRMRSQPRYSAYTGMRDAPEGTVARETLPDDSVNLTPVDSARGHAQYQTFCALCHGDSHGTVGLVGVNMDKPSPTIFARDSGAVLNVERMFEIVSKGGQRMPAFAASMSAQDRWQVASYVQTLYSDRQRGPHQ